MAVSHGSGHGHAAATPVAPHHKRHAELKAKAPWSAETVGNPRHRNEGEEHELRRLAKRIAAEGGA